MKNAATFEVRSVVSPYTLVPSMREIVREIDPDMPMYSVMTQTDQIETSLRTERLFARLAALLGGVAVLLSAIGLYGLLAYGVARRTPEIGLRMALGAERALVRWMILRESLILAAVGLLLGIPAALVGRPRPAVDALRSCADGSRYHCGRRAVDARAGRACRLHTRKKSLACRSDGGPSRGLGVACVTRLIESCHVRRGPADRRVRADPANVDRCRSSRRDRISRGGAETAEIWTVAARRAAGRDVRGRPVAGRRSSVSARSAALREKGLPSQSARLTTRFG